MTNFSTQDIEQIQKHGLTVDIVTQQLQNFITGFPYSDIVAPATIGNGVFASPTDESNIEYYRTHQDNYKIVKFVPASGAATRMFKDLFEYISSGAMNKTTQTVLSNLENFAFWSDLKSVLPDNATDTDKIRYLITECGLNYGNMPKALLAFHKYENENRTAAAEHLIEGALYAQSNHNVNIHFTVSPEHKPGFDKLLAQIVPEYENRFGVKYNITMSTQRASTDTIAVNPDNTPFRNEDGTLLFRPAGHGALIENLNDIDGDIAFIKNIDNICTDKLRTITVYHKEQLAGLLLKTMDKTFEYLNILSNAPSPEQINEIAKYATDQFGIKFDHTPSANELHTILNRPIRVCGIIKNTGEPGGGPFWVRDENGDISLQIAEPGQIAPEKIDILKNGEFFSPTDLVCCLRDYRGNKFNLLEYVDPRTGFISNKSKNGRPLRAMERPGLWNGAMAKWLTIFVATPLETFTPVKVITDLLGETHNDAA